MEPLDALANAVSATTSEPIIPVRDRVDDSGDAKHRSTVLQLVARDQQQHRLYRRYGKVVFDRVGGVALLILTLPLSAVIAAVVRLRLGSPVFYPQERVGLNGTPFLMYKFRTMKADRRGAALPFAHPDRRVRHKTADDPSNLAQALEKLGRCREALPYAQAAHRLEPKRAASLLKSVRRCAAAARKR